MNLQNLVDAIRDRAPGPGDSWFTVPRTTMLEIPWNVVVDPPIQRVICDELEAISRFDEYGNYQFQLTKDSVRRRTRLKIEELLEHRIPFVPVEVRASKQLIDKIMEIIEREGR